MKDEEERMKEEGMKDEGGRMNEERMKDEGGRMNSAFSPQPSSFSPQPSSFSLHPSHYHMLAVESGISDEVIRQRGYRTVTEAAELRRLGFAPAQCRPPGLLLPLWTTGGHVQPRDEGDLATESGLPPTPESWSLGSLWRRFLPVSYVYRPDNPRVVEDRRKKLPDGTYKQRVIKYELVQGTGVRLDCPPACRDRLGDPATPLFITEGQKKADSLASRGACAVALLGVWNFKGKNEFGGVTFLADFDYIALKGRPVYIVFDSDVMTKPPVRAALDRLSEHLKRRGAVVHVIYLPAVVEVAGEVELPEEVTGE